MKSFLESAVIIAFLVSLAVISIAFIGCLISVGILALSFNFWLGLLVLSSTASGVIYLIAQVIPE